MITILFLAANPKDTNQLRLGEEMRTIQERLRGSEHRESFKIEQEWAVRVSDIQGHLMRHKPHIVHFSGHGSIAGEIILETDAGESKPVSEQALKRLFTVLKDNIRCVVLNACFSKKQAYAIAEAIDCVVGMTTLIGNRAAISFAASFYQALGYGRSIYEAYELGRGQIELEGLGEEDTPKLVTASGIDASKIYLHRSLDNTSSAKDSPSTVKVDRSGLIRRLSGLPVQQFNELLFSINPPRGIVPPPTAAHGDRVFALLGWAEGTGGCGLDKVEEALEAIIRS